MINPAAAVSKPKNPNACIGRLIYLVVKNNRYKIYKPFEKYLDIPNFVFSISSRMMFYYNLRKRYNRSNLQVPEYICAIPRKH